MKYDPDIEGDGLRTCEDCGEDTANSGLCDSCKRQKELDDGPDCCEHGIHVMQDCPECKKAFEKFCEEEAEKW